MDLAPGAALGLLADRARLRVVAALVLGAATAAEVQAATGLGSRAVAQALDRLARAGLVERTGDLHRFAEDELGALATAAAKAAASTAAGGSHDVPGAAPEHARVLRNFVRDGRLVSIPSARAKRLAVLDHLAGHFQPGRVYPEREVNAMLSRFHADFAALRRYLVDEEFLERRDGFYWRAGGTFDVDADSGDRP